MAAWRNHQPTDDDLLRPARPAQHPAVDDVRAGEAGATQPRVVLAACRAQALRGAEAARRIRSGDRHVGVDRQATAHHVRDHAGRAAALKRWLDEAPAAPTLEFEALVKVFFADGGTWLQLRATIEHIEREATDASRCVARDDRRRAERRLDTNSAPRGRSTPLRCGSNSITTSCRSAGRNGPGADRDVALADGRCRLGLGGRARRLTVLSSPMELQETLKRRRMIRSFRPDPVDPDVLDRILATCVHAPSAGFSQGTELLVLTEPDAVGCVLGAQRASRFPDAARAHPAAAAGRGRRALESRRLHRALRGDRQDRVRARPGRQLARAVLGRRCRYGDDADAAGGRRGGTWRVLRRPGRRRAAHARPFRRAAATSGRSDSSGLGHPAEQDVASAGSSAFTRRRRPISRAGAQPTTGSRRVPAPRRLGPPRAGRSLGSTRSRENTHDTDSS